MRKSFLRNALLALSCAAPGLCQTGFPRATRPLDFSDSTRIHDLVRAGNLYLSLQDALALAIENNLDIELQRYSLPVAATDLLRSKGGGVVRGLNYFLSEAPVGVGGPLSPVVTNPAASVRATDGASIATNALELGVLERAAGQSLAAGHHLAIERHTGSRLRPGPRRAS